MDRGGGGRRSPPAGQGGATREAGNTVLYVGLFLTVESWEQLLACIQKCPGGVLPRAVVEPHITLCYAPAADELERCGAVGRCVAVRVARVFSHPRLQATDAEILDDGLAAACAAEQPHVTVATDGATAARHAGGLLSYSRSVPLPDGPLTLTCVLGWYVAGHGPCCSPADAIWARRHRAPHAPPLRPPASVGAQGCTGAAADGARDPLEGTAGELYSRLVTLPPRQGSTREERDGNARWLRLRLPSRQHAGVDWQCWPRQAPLLHKYVKAGWKEGVRWLVEELGFDVNHRRAKDLCTPLHVAEYYRNADMTALLIELGADPLVENAYGGEMPAEARRAGEAAGADAAAPPRRRRTAAGPPTCRCRLFIALEDVLQGLSEGLQSAGGAQWGPQSDANGDLLRSLPWATGGREVWGALRGRRPVVLCGLSFALGEASEEHTARRAQWAARSQQQWAAERLGAEAAAVHVAGGAEAKARFAASHECLLVDACPEACRRWRAGGGAAVQHRSWRRTVAAVRALLGEQDDGLPAPGEDAAAGGPGLSVGDWVTWEGAPRGACGRVSAPPSALLPEAVLVARWPGDRGREEWAPLARDSVTRIAEPPAERRVDIADSLAYTASEFAAFYGAEKEWDAAAGMRCPWQPPLGRCLPGAELIIADPSDDAEVRFIAGDGAARYSVNGEARRAFRLADLGEDDQGFFIEFPDLPGKCVGVAAADVHALIQLLDAGGVARNTTLLSGEGGAEEGAVPPSRAPPTPPLVELPDLPPWDHVRRALQLLLPANREAAGGADMAATAAAVHLRAALRGAPPPASPPAADQCAVQP